MSEQGKPKQEAPEAEAHQTKRDLRADARQRALRSDAKASYKALVAAARELFAERGPDGLTIVEVAKRAGLNRSTAYQHFRNRQQLSEAVAEQFFHPCPIDEPCSQANLGDQFLLYNSTYNLAHKIDCQRYPCQSNQAVTFLEKINHSGCTEKAENNFDRI